MKKLILAAFLLTACNEDAPKDAIASVNGEAIGKSEIEKVLAQFTGLPDAKMENYPADFQKELLNKYVEKKLLTKAGYDAGFAKNEEIKQQIKEAEEFLVEQMFLDTTIAEAVKEENLKKLYESEVLSREGEMEVQASHILVKTEEEAKDIAAKLKKGQKFEKLAEKYSIDPGSKINGGDLGFFRAEKMIPAFSDVAFALEKGAVSEPTKTTFGWHIIKKVDEREITIPSFEDSKEALKTEAARRAVQKKVADLRAAANVEITYDFPTAQAPKVEETPKEAEEDKAEEKPAEKTEEKK